LSTEGAPPETSWVRDTRTGHITPSSAVASGSWLLPDSISGNEAARLVPRRECSTTRPRRRRPGPATRPTSAHPPTPAAAQGRTQGRRASVPAVSASQPMPSTQPARRQTECAYAPDYRPDHGRSAHCNTSPGAVC
jgi:hypothetical protein